MREFVLFNIRTNHDKSYFIIWMHMLARCTISFHENITLVNNFSL